MNYCAMHQFREPLRKNHLPALLDKQPEICNIFEIREMKDPAGKILPSPCILDCLLHSLKGYMCNERPLTFLFNKPKSGVIVEKLISATIRKFE